MPIQMMSDDSTPVSMGISQLHDLLLLPLVSTGVPNGKMTQGGSWYMMQYRSLVQHSATQIDHAMVHIE